MRYDKSLKLINYAKLWQFGAAAGNIELFTELDHSFKVGDKVYIVGGYYDNCNQQVYSTGDHYNQYSTGYTVLAVDGSHGIILDIPYVSDVFYPYGINTNNKYGDPFNNTHKAYNCYTTTMQKDVYISTCAFTRGIMKKGTINNGIFGNDYHTVVLNNKGIVSGTVSNTDLVINHIVGKNVEISKGQINSKTDASNLPSSKIKLVEDSTIFLTYLTNPFGYASVAVNNNNDGFGYNYFERITNTATDIIINNGTFANPNSSFIALNNLSINNARLGGNSFNKLLSNQIDNVTMNGGYVGDINTLNDKFSIYSGTVNTFIPLTLEIGNPTPVAYNAALKQIDIEVEYDVLANQYTAVGDTVYITGITGTVNYNLSHLTGTIAAMSYTFGTINSAVISIVFDIPGVVTGGDWTAWKTANPVTNYDFSNMKIHLLQHIFEAGQLSAATISTYLDSSVNFTTPDLVIENSTVIEGYYNGVTLKGVNNFTGTTKGSSAYLTTSSQIDQDTVASSSTFTYTRIYGNKTPLTGNFTNAYIQQGMIHHSNMDSTVCIPKTLGTDVIFLYDVRLIGLMYLHDEVYWDIMNAGEVTKSSITGTTTYVQGAYLGNGRNTAWSTAPQILGDPTFKQNPNRILAMPHDSTNGILYQSQSIANSANSAVLGLTTNLTKKFHVPTSDNIQDPLTTSDIIVIIDKGSLSLTANNWSNTYNRNDVLYAAYLAGGTLDTNIANRNSVTTLPANDADFPFVDQGLAYRDLNQIDTNYIYTSTYFRTPHAREASEINLHIYEQAPLIAPYDNQFPDPGFAASLTTELKIQGVGTFQCADAATENVSDGIYDQMYLKVINTVDNNVAAPAALVPECFIEIERVRVNQYSIAFGAITKSWLYHPNYTHMNFDRLEQTVSAGMFTNIEIPLYQDKMLPIPIEMEVSAARPSEVVVEYWVTWFYYETGYNAATDGTTSGYKGSARTKRTQTFRFN